MAPGETIGSWNGDISPSNSSRLNLRISKRPLSKTIKFDRKSSILTIDRPVYPTDLQLSRLCLKLGKSLLGNLM